MYEHFYRAEHFYSCFRPVRVCDSKVAVSSLSKFYTFQESEEAWVPFKTTGHRCRIVVLNWECGSSYSLPDCFDVSHAAPSPALVCLFRKAVWLG